MIDPDQIVRQLSRGLELNESVIALHYSCESFVTAKNHPPGVACITMYDLVSRDVTALSCADSPQDVPLEERELDMLTRFFDRLVEVQDTQLIHWNMNRPEYGFDALATRLRYLNPSAHVPPIPPRRLDLDGLFVDHFGETYAPHGRLESMANLNDLDVRSFLKGKDEADRYSDGDWAALTRSSTSKVKIIGELLRRLTNGTVRTTSSAGVVGFAGARLDAVKAVAGIADRFVLVKRSLRKHPHGRPTITFKDEWDDQYLFRALLRLFFEDVRDEDFTPSYAGSNSRVDYLLPEFHIAIELKLASQTLLDKDIGAQLIVDRDRYKSNQQTNHLICIVFDPDGWVSNPRGIERDLQVDVSEVGMTVSVLVVDR